MRLLLLALILPLSAQAPTARWDEQGFYRLMNEQDDFVRELWGCPARGYPPEITCLPSAGKFNLKQWNKVFATGHEFFKE